MPLTLPRAFQWGPHFHYLHSTMIAFSTLLQLHEVPTSLQKRHKCHVQMAQPRSLSFHLLTIAEYCASPPPFSKRGVLSVLTSLNYQRITQYLSDLVAKIDTPRLEDIDITSFNRFIHGPSKFNELLGWIEIHIVEQTFYPLSMLSVSPLHDQRHLCALSCKSPASHCPAVIIHGSYLQ